MAFGLRVWAGGVLQLEFTDRITAYYGVLGWSIPASTYRTHLYIPGIHASQWFAYTDAQFAVADIINDHVRITWATVSNPYDRVGNVWIFKG
jgi:hypothetical protein